MKKKTYRCLLCHTKYPTKEMAELCPWVHIFRKDRFFKSLNLPK